MSPQHSAGSALSRGSARFPGSLKCTCVPSPPATRLQSGSPGGSPQASVPDCRFQRWWPARCSRPALPCAWAWSRTEWTPPWWWWKTGCRARRTRRREEELRIMLPHIHIFAAAFGQNPPTRAYWRMPGFWRHHLAHQPAAPCISRKWNFCLFLGQSSSTPPRN